MTILPSVDWKLAGLVGGRLAPPGPQLDRTAIAEAVAELHAAADLAIDLVSSAAELGIRASPPVFAVDRANWAIANAELIAEFVVRVDGEPPTSKPRSGAADATLPLRRKIARRANAAGLGLGLAVLGRHVLGQYDPFLTRLLLVVPNVLELERAFGLVASDFRLWTCLHEQTHAVQFRAAPWMAGHIVDLVRRVGDDTAMVWVGKLSPTATKDASEALDDAMALMALLEGHADVMMDIAGRDAIPTWHHLRTTFTSARGGRRSVLLARMGVMGKAEQYAKGAEFCQKVIEMAGIEALNRAFASVEHLPRIDELEGPETWLRRTSG